jgi:hypothetical protein
MMRITTSRLAAGAIAAAVALLAPAAVMGPAVAHEDAAVEANCAVVAPWAQNLRKHMDGLRADHPRHVAKVCGSVAVTAAVGNSTAVVESLDRALRNCNGSDDCSYVVSEVVDLMGRASALRDYARNGRCSAAVVPSPC